MFFKCGYLMWVFCFIYLSLFKEDYLCMNINIFLYFCYQATSPVASLFVAMQHNVSMNGMWSCTLTDVHWLIENTFLDLLVSERIKELINMTLWTIAWIDRQCKHLFLCQHVLINVCEQVLIPRADCSTCMILLLFLIHMDLCSQSC